MNLSEMSVRRAVTVSMIYLGVVGFGIFSYLRLPRDLFPDLTFPTIVIITQYNGAGPSDVEQLVTRPIESAVASVEGVKTVRSTSKYGVSVVLLEFNWGTDMAKAETDVRKNIDLFVRNMPDEVEKPLTFAFDPSLQPITFLMLSGPEGPAAVRHLSETLVEPRLERIPGVASADTAGGLKREIQVELRPERLRALRVDASQVVNAIRMANMQLPGGAIRQAGQLLSIDTKGRYTSVHQIARTIVVRRPMRTIRVEDVAQVRDWHQDLNRVISVNGKPAVMILVRKQSDANTLIVANRIVKQLPKIIKVLPKGFKIQVMFNQATIIKRSLGNVVRTGWQSFLMAGIVLFLFLFSLKASLIVAAAIPLSLLVAFSAMDASGISLNMISTSGLALGIGMLVDNAIVVLENIFRHFQMGEPPANAAVKGAKEVSMAITASTMTTLAVFIPVLFVPGIAGALFKDMVLTICFSLAASLIVALTLIPMATSRLLKPNPNKKKGPFLRLADRIKGSFNGFLNAYAWFLRFSLRFRKTTLLVGIALFVASIFILKSVGTDFLAKGDQGRIELQVTTNSSNNLDQTKKLLAQVEKVAIKAVPEAEMFSSDVGTGEGIGAVFGSGEFAGRVRIKLPPLSKRKRKQATIEEAMRKAVKDIPGVKVRPFVFNMTGSEGDLEIHIFIHDLVKGRLLADRVRTVLEDIPGVRDVKHNLEDTTPQIQIRLNRERLSQLGTNPGRATATISTYYMGTVASYYQENGDDYKILVRTPKRFRDHIERLRNLPVFVGQGVPMPMGSIAHVKDTMAPTQIEREGQKRVVKVIANVYNRPLGDVLTDVQHALKSKVRWPNNVVWTIEGSAKDMKESFSYLGLAFIAAIFLVYMVMASQFESLLEPFVILLSIPLAVIGVAAALYLTHTPITMTAAIGIVMLVGIVVNNAIVLIDFLKQRWDRKWDTLIDAAVAAATIRLRPILMTTLTTILAMLPMALGIGEGSETWAPMARTVIGGLTTSMILTLVIVPAWYVLIAGTIARHRERRAVKKAAKLAAKTAATQTEEA